MREGKEGGRKGGREEVMDKREGRVEKEKREGGKGNKYRERRGERKE